MKTIATQIAAQTSEFERAAYLLQRDGRKKCTFGKVWKSHVIAGTITDRVKLVEHAFKLKLGKSRYDLKKLKYETLLGKVQAVLIAEREATAITVVFAK